MLSHTFGVLKQKRQDTLFDSTSTEVFTTESGFVPTFHFTNSRSTRPFLESIEKRWIAYQLLCGLRDCHAKKVSFNERTIWLTEDSPRRHQNRKRPSNLME